MPHQLFANIEEMLAPAVVSRAEDSRVTRVMHTPVSMPESLSGSRDYFLRVETDSGTGQRYIVKRISCEWDWIMRASDDCQGREVSLWQQGIFDHLPPEVTHAVVACATDGAGRAILMRDVSTSMNRSWYDPITVSEHDHYLSALASLHAAFWDGRHQTASVPGLCSLRHRVLSFSPETGRREAGGSDELPPILLEGWEKLQPLLDADVATVVYELLEDPQPLCAALGRYPQTLVHGDPRRANMGLLQGERDQLVLLDWQLAGLAPPAVDLAWYLLTNSTVIPVTRDHAVATYRGRLADLLGCRFDEAWWHPQLELSLLVGFLQLGWSFAVEATDPNLSEAYRSFRHSEIGWWSRHIRAATSWL